MKRGWFVVVDLFMFCLFIVCVVPLWIIAAWYPRLDHTGWGPFFWFAPLTFDGFGASTFSEEVEIVDVGKSNE